MCCSINASEIINSKVRPDLTPDTRTCERKHSLYRSDKKSQSVHCPVTRIYERSENVGDRALRSKVDEGNEDSEKAKNMNYEHDCFNLWKHTSKICVDGQ